ncbi:MAG: hypothetical protein U1E05_10295, partial [Patescibacteria group bacterium]|nr:hypothetical protein [Patescibacteria group bacterium]
MSIFDEGTVAFWLEHPHQDWQTNASDYRFGPFIFSQVGFAVGVVKHPDKRLDVTIAGPFQKTTTFETRIPDVTPYPNLHVAITWQRPKLNLFLAGRQVSEWTIEETTDSSARATLPIVIRGADPTPPQETVEQVLDQLWNVFSTIEAFLIASDLKSLENALQVGLERPKFRVQESYVG